MGKGFRELLVGKPVLVLHGEETVFDAAREMRDFGESIIAVVDEEGKIQGVATPKDLVYRAVAEGRDPKKTPVSKVMTPDPFCADITDGPEELPRKLLESHYSAVPLLMDGIPCGRLLEREIRAQQAKAIESLSSGQEEERMDAAHFLAGSGGPPAVLALTQALKDRSAAVREIALEGLLKEKSQMAVISLLPLLREEDTVVRNSAIEILSQIGSIALDKICGMSRDPDEDVRIFAMNIISNRGDKRAVYAVIAAMDDPSPRVVQAAVVAAGELKDPGLVPHLRKLLEHEDQWTRLSAVEALGKMGGNEAEESLLSVLGTRDETLFLTLVETLAELGVEGLARKIVTEAVEFEPDIVSQALVSLAEKLGPEALDGVPTDLRKRVLETFIINKLNSGMEELEEKDVSLALALGNPSIARRMLEESEVLPREDPRRAELMKGLSRPCYMGMLTEFVENEIRGRETAVGALLKIGDPAASGKLLEKMPDLYEPEKVMVLDLLPENTRGLLEAAERILKTGSAVERLAAARALGRIGGPRAIGTLKEFIGSRTGYSEAEAAAVEAIVAQGALESPGECRLLDDDRPHIRLTALKKLKDSLPFSRLEAFIGDKDPEVARIALEECLKRDPEKSMDYIREIVSGEDPEKLQAVFRIIEDNSIFQASGVLEDFIEKGGDDWSRFLAVQTLGRLKGDEAVPLLSRLLSSGHRMIEVAAAQALKEIGSGDAMEVLLGAGEHPNDEVRMLVSEVSGGK